MSNYKVLIRSFELKPGIPDLTGDEIAADLTMGIQKMLEDVEKGMQNFPESGNWEIIDHHLLRLDRHLVMSVLVKKV